MHTLTNNGNRGASTTQIVAIAVVVIIVIAAAAILLTRHPSPTPSTTTSSSATSTPSSSTSVPPVTSSSPTSPPTTTTPYANQTLSVQVSQSFGTIDPAVGTDYTQFIAMIDLYDNLVTQLPNGSVVPHVAKSWTISPNGTVYTFVIHSHIMFHAGNYMNASDVAFSMDRMLAIGQGFSWMWSGVLNQSGIAVLNSTAIQFHLRKVYAPFLGSLSLFFIVDKQVVMQHLANVTAANPMGDWGYAWMQTHEAGSGPYMLQSWQRGVQITFTRFNNYWLGWPSNHVYFQTVVYKIIESDATVLSLAKENQIQWTSTFLAVPTYQALQQMGWKWLTFTSPNIFDLKLNTEKAPLNNIWLRRAIVYAFNYSSIQYILPGAVESAGPVANNYMFHNPAIKPVTQNLTLAKEMLAKSGLAPGSISLTIVYVQGNIPEQEIALEFQKDMAQIGISVSIQPQTWETITQLAANPNTTPDVTEVYYDPLYPDTDSYFYPQYDSASHGTWISMEWLTNSTIDQLIQEERSTLNLTLRQQIFYKLQQDIVSLAPDVFVFNQPYYVALAPSVANYTYYNGMSFDYNAYNMYYSGTGSSAAFVLPSLGGFILQDIRMAGGQLVLW
jgi:peptide/nickel transport system substrate-binding protein